MTIELFEDAAIRQKVSEVWGKVFDASSQVIKHANIFGFLGMGIIPSPNIHEMLVTLQIFSSIIDILITNADKLDIIGYEETRLMLNAKEQITRMERLAAALQANNKEDYELALVALEKQAAF
jgi:hypothetical protein